VCGGQYNQLGESHPRVAAGINKKYNDRKREFRQPRAFDHKREFRRPRQPRPP
jgi:hypothetical protein